MPFGLRYGEHTFGAWYAVPVTVGSQQFDLSISTSLSQTWVPGKSMCSSDSNVTACTAAIGGTFNKDKSSTWKANSGQTGVKIQDELLEGFYNKTISTDLIVQSGDGKKLLAMEGVGDVGTDNIALVSDTGSFNMTDQTVGVINSGDKEYMANGYLSLQQMALSLYADQLTPSPTFHLFQGMASYMNDSQLNLQGSDYGKYSLIFGGYDSANLDLNTTQQYPLIETDFTTGKTSTNPTATDAALPASQTVSYGMQVMLDDIVYRWTVGGTTDNSLLPKPKLAIIDSTTPWVWLPKSAFDAMISISGAVWNSTYNAYTIPYCLGWDTCNSVQDRSFGAMLDFKFDQMDGDKLTLRFDDYFNIRYLPSNDSQVYMVPIKELPEDSPVILGRPFLAGIHLWVDYAEMYWGMAQGNTTQQYITTSQVVPWDRSSHPPITNTSILVQRQTDDGTSSSGNSTSGNPASGDSKDPAAAHPPLSIGAIAGIGAGGGVLLLGLAIIGCFMFRRRGKGPKRNSHRPESMIELHAGEFQKISELPQEGQFRPHELPQQGQFRPHELPPNAGQPNKFHEMPSGAYYKPQELANSGQYQVPPPPQGPPPQQGFYSPVTPVSPAGQAYHYPPPQQGMYPQPPSYQPGPGGPVYYEMDASRGGH